MGLTTSVSFQNFFNEIGWVSLDDSRKNQTPILIYKEKHNLLPLLLAIIPTNRLKCVLTSIHNPK
jgi:hypothetical protein